MASDDQLQADIRRYYATVSRFMDAELQDRGDEDLWRAVGLDQAIGSILEVGCGSGRVTELLAASGARVVGIDLSPELLRIAWRRFADRPNVQLVIADMRQPALCAQFQAIVAADDPFSHLTSDDDRERAMGALASHLAPGGRLLIDALWFPAGQERDTEATGRVRSHDMDVHGHAIHVTERWQCDAETRRCSADYEYTADGGAGASTTAHFEARYWSPEELRSRLAAAGLEITGWWGGYHQEAWSPRSSQHLVVEATRG
jgi:SAM-dependent methyltransferase